MEKKALDRSLNNEQYGKSAGAVGYNFDLIDEKGNLVPEEDVRLRLIQAMSLKHHPAGAPRLTIVPHAGKDVQTELTSAILSLKHYPAGSSYAGEEPDVVGEEVIESKKTYTASAQTAAQGRAVKAKKAASGFLLNLLKQAQG